MSQASANLNIMIKAARRAARGLLRDFGEVENLQVSSKSAGDFVSKADIKAEETIYEELSEARPNYGWIGEESEEKKGRDPTRKWIVDPLDGTSNFLHGIPHWAISIGLEYKKEIITGVIYDPIKDEIFYAEKDSGAFFNNQRIRVSKKNEINDCLFATGGKFKTEPDIPYRKSGCAALDMAYVASGRYDGYFQNGLNLWDIAAGIIILKEAGGVINKIDLSKNNNIQIIASSMAINDKLLEKLKNF